MVNRTKAAPRPRLRLELDERRQKLLELGRNLFGKHTYDELSISDIAGLAGISKGLLYHYFPTKRDFYVETVRAAADEILRLTDVAEEIADPRARLMHSMDRYLEYVEANAAAYISLLKSGIGVDPEVAAVVENVRLTFMKRLLDQLGTKKPTAEQRLALRGWIGAAEAISLDWLKTGELTRQEVSRLLAKQLGLSLFSVGLLPKIQLNLLKGLKGVFG